MMCVCARVDRRECTVDDVVAEVRRLPVFDDDSVAKIKRFESTAAMEAYRANDSIAAGTKAFFFF